MRVLLLLNSTLLFNSLQAHAVFNWTSWPDNTGAVAVQLDKMITGKMVPITR